MYTYLIISIIFAIFLNLCYVYFSIFIVLCPFYVYMYVGINIYFISYSLDDDTKLKEEKNKTKQIQNSAYRRQSVPHRS